MLLHEKIVGRRLILASRSPRRQELLSGTGLPFVQADDYQVEEIYPCNIASEQVPEFLARLKSESYPQPLAKGDILITADTVVILDGRVLGKPSSREDAIEMLSNLSGARHSVVTGVMIRSAECSELFSSTSHVWFRALSLDEIEYYVDTYRPMDKAGSYGIQEWIGYVAIERIEGSFYNVMGLPVQLLYTKLAQFL